MPQKILFSLLIAISCFAENNSLAGDFVIQKGWKILAHDGQFFSLTEEKLNSKTELFVNFGRGQNTLRAFPVSKEKWTEWKNEIVKLMTSLPSSGKCDHPTVFQNEQKGKETKDKEVCLSALTKSERDKVKKLTQQWNQYLYGK